MIFSNVLVRVLISFFKRESEEHVVENVVKQLLLIEQQLFGASANTTK